VRTLVLSLLIHHVNGNARRSCGSFDPGACAPDCPGKTPAQSKAAESKTTRTRAEKSDACRHTWRIPIIL